MAGSLIFNGPQPGNGDEYCALCTMLYKGAANQSETVRAALSAANEMDEDGSRVVSIIGARGDYLPGRTEPQLAVTTGFNLQLQKVIVQLMGLPPDAILPPVLAPLCWTHTQGLEIKQGGVIPVAAGALAGLPPVPGSDKAVDMSRRNRG